MIFQINSSFVADKIQYDNLGSSRNTQITWNWQAGSFYRNGFFKWPYHIRFNSKNQIYIFSNRVESSQD